MTKREGDFVPKIITSLGAKRVEKENKGKRTELGVSQDGYLLYPEHRVEITVEEALRLADGVIEQYKDSEVLFEDFRRREELNPLRPLEYRPLDDEILRRKMEEGLADQRGFARLSATKSLLEVMELHKENPAHFYGIRVLAIAEALKKRLGPRVPQSGGEG